MPPSAPIARSCARRSAAPARHLQFAPEPEQVVTVDEAEQGERGRQAALGAVGEDLAGAVPPRLVRLDFENGPAGQHIRSTEWQAGLGEATQLDGEHVADPVLFK